MHEFQSLIGTIKTFESRSFENIRQMFQSLIGTIKTISHTSKCEEQSIVSIPYRDDKNFIFFEN